MAIEPPRRDRSNLPRNSGNGNTNVHGNVNLQGPNGGWSAGGLNANEQVRDILHVVFKQIHSDFKIETYQIDEHTPASGHSIKDLKIHSEIDATVIAVRRGEQIIPNPEPEFIFKPRDILYLIGKREKV